MYIVVWENNSLSYKSVYNANRTDETIAVKSQKSFTVFSNWGPDTLTHDH